MERKDKMIPVERREFIIKELHRKKVVKVSQLSKSLSVTEETIRRDLERLEEEGKLKKVHGGAVLYEQAGSDLSFNDRIERNRYGKEKIAMAIASKVKDGDSIMLDSSTTSLEIAKLLTEKNDLTIITNSFAILQELYKNDSIRVISTGGELSREYSAFKGQAAIRTIDNYRVDLAIISCKALDMNHGIMDSRDMEVEIKRKMIALANRVYLGVDDQKFDKIAFVKVCDISSVDCIFTNKNLDDDWRKYLRENNVSYIMC